MHNMLHAMLDFLQPFKVLIHHKIHNIHQCAVIVSICPKGCIAKNSM